MLISLIMALVGLLLVMLDPDLHAPGFIGGLLIIAGALRVWLLLVYFPYLDWLDREMR